MSELPVILEEEQRIFRGSDQHIEVGRHARQATEQSRHSDLLAIRYRLGGYGPNQALRQRIQSHSCVPQKYPGTGQNVACLSIRGGRVEELGRS
jgi:hypothetical protein